MMDNSKDLEFPSLEFFLYVGWNWNQFSQIP